MNLLTNTTYSLSATRNDLTELCEVLDYFLLHYRDNENYSWNEDKAADDGLKETIEWAEQMHSILVVRK